LRHLGEYGILRSTMHLNIVLAEAFLETPDGVLSIHQISKRLGLPYGTAYNRVHLLVQQGIVCMTPQGKAKLCTLNPRHPMTACLLALGAARTTGAILSGQDPLAQFTLKVRMTLEERLGDDLQVALILNFDHVRETANLSGSAPETVAQKDVGTSGQPPSLEWPLDLFVVTTQEALPPEELETAIHGFLPPEVTPRLTCLTVSPSTLVGMFQERENEAGIAAFHMLRRGLLLTGFERFFQLVLRAFPARLG
jgi:hypothetical protein